MFRGNVKGTGYPLHSPVSPSLPLPCVTVCHHISTGLYYELRKNKVYTELCSRRSKVKVKVTPQHAMRAQGGVRFAALPIQNLLARGGGGSAPHPRCFTPGIIVIAQEAGWPSGSVWMGVENSVFTGFQTPDRPARSESLYGLRHSDCLL